MSRVLHHWVLKVKLKIMYIHCWLMLILRNVENLQENLPKCIEFYRMKIMSDGLNLKHLNSKDLLSPLQLLFLSNHRVKE